MASDSSLAASRPAHGGPERYRARRSHLVRARHADRPAAPWGWPAAVQVLLAVLITGCSSITSRSPFSIVRARSKAIPTPASTATSRPRARFRPATRRRPWRAAYALTRLAPEGAQSSGFWVAWWLSRDLSRCALPQRCHRGGADWVCGCLVRRRRNNVALSRRMEDRKIGRLKD